jgi:hypothetical protein
MTTVHLPDELVRELMTATGQPTAEAAVLQVVTEYLQRQKQRRILEFASTFNADPTHDYKEQRRRP